MDADVVGIGDPERQLPPPPDLVLEQELVVDPHRSRRFRHGACVHELAPRDAGPREVERAGQPSRARAHDPIAEVADVDELDAAFGRCGDEDVPAAREAVRPVREPPRRIVWADDEPRASDEGAVAEHLAYGLLAERLERAV